MKRVALFISIFMSGLILSCATEQEYDYASVNFFIGEVAINGKTINIGDTIKENDTLVTGQQSSCDVKIGKSIIRIKEKSSLTFTKLLFLNGKETTDLSLEIGRMLCKPKKLLKGENFSVRTPTAVAAVRGTQFTVEADRLKTTRIKVFDGKVKVVKRVKALDANIDKVLENVAPLAEKEQVVVTQKQATLAEKQVAKLVGKKVTPAELAKAITKIEKEVKIGEKLIKEFKPEDFVEERKEIIAVEEKPEKVIDAIKKFIKEDKATKAPQGRLLITRYEVYLIKEGKIVWEGDVIVPPKKYKDKIFIAAGGYVFCASPKGPVFWRTKVNNDGNLKFKGNEVIVTTDGKEKKINFDNGDLL